MAVKRKSHGKSKSWPVVMAAALVLPEQTTVVQGVQAIVANCLAQIRGNQSGVAYGSDPECVHQMRVGLRRLNSALGMFRGQVRCPPKVLTDLAWIRHVLGAVRDWDVLVDETLAEMPTMGIGADGLMSLYQAIAVHAYRNRLLAQDAVMSSRYMQCLLNLEKWLTSLGNGVSDTSLPEFARQVLAQRRDNLHKRGVKLSKGNPEQRHRTRIAAKKVRYATEFFRSWYSQKEMRSYLKALAALQEALGWLNDAAVASELLAQLVREQPELSYSAGFAQGYLVARSRREIHRLGRLWERFRSLPAPGS